MSVRLKIILAAEVGFLVAIACGVLQMILFGARQNTWWISFLTHRLPLVVCPAWALGDSWIIAIPFLKAASYAAVTIIWEKLRLGTVRQASI